MSGRLQRPDSPLADAEGARGEAILPAVVVVLGVEDAVLVFLRGDVLLPLLLAVAVFAAQPAVVPSLRLNAASAFSLPRAGWRPPLSNSPLPRRSLWACGSASRSPGQSCWSSPPPSRASETAATARRADPYLRLNEETDQPGGAKGRAPVPGETHCCFPSCRSRGLALLHCVQRCSSQRTGTSSQLLCACISVGRQLGQQLQRLQPHPSGGGGNTSN